MNTAKNPHRRHWLLRTAGLGAGILVGAHIPSGDAPAAGNTAADTGYAPNAFLHIALSGDVTVLIGQAEMGQGIATGLAAVVADELGASWSRVGVRFATGRPEYLNPAFGNTEQMTGGSRSMQAFFLPMRRAAASAREVLVAAAAEAWNVEPQDCRTDNGAVVLARDGRQLSFETLLPRARQLTLSDKPALKPAKAFTLIGRELPRLDTPAKVAGTAAFAIDVQRPDMLYAAVRHAPVLGSEVASFTGVTPGAESGVVTTVRLPGAVAVVATSAWKAQQAADALEIVFTKTSRDLVSSDTVAAQLRAALDTRRAVPAPNNRGDVHGAFAAAAKRVDAEYAVPFLAHATMEPLNCTAEVTPNGCDLWIGTQAPTIAAKAVARTLGLDATKVRVHMAYLGGGFGRRGSGEIAVQAALCARATRRPVKVIWSREEDMRADFFRPAMAVRLAAALDTDGRPMAFTARVAGGGVLIENRPEAVKDGLDAMAIIGLADASYPIPARFTDYAEVKPPVRIGFWRGTSNSQNTFFLESFIDELAHAAGHDPYHYRRMLLEDDARGLAVLDEAARLARWDEGTAGRHLGIAYLHSERWKSRVAMVVELSRAGDALQIERIFCAADGGLVINPNLARQNLEGGIVFGLSAALFGEITLAEGRVQQSNFHDYPVLRMSQVPEMDIRIVEGDTAPGSFGEISCPVVAPALANAVFAATGQRYRQLPLKQLEIRPRRED